MGWLQDAAGLIVAASDRSGANHLWKVSYPAGDVRQITDDGSKNYAGVSMTADATLLATVQRDSQSYLWMADPPSTGHGRRVTAGKYDGRFGIAWTRDGRIVYHSMESGNEDLWVMNADGSGPPAAHERSWRRPAPVRLGG